MSFKVNSLAKQSLVHITSAICELVPGLIEQCITLFGFSLQFSSTFSWLNEVIGINNFTGHVKMILTDKEYKIIKFGIMGIYYR